MKMKKFALILLLIPSLLCSCNNDKGDEIFLLNGDCYLGEENSIVEMEESDIKSLMKLNTNFVLYLSKSSCHWCEEFAPIMSDYVSNHETLVVSPKNEISEEFKVQLFQDETPSFPYVAIVKGNEIKKVDNDQYMQTKNVFNKYMNSLKKKSNFYFSTKLPENPENLRQMCHILINTKIENDFKIFNEKIKDRALNSDTITLLNFDNSYDSQFFYYDDLGVKYILPLSHYAMEQIVNEIY